MELQLQMLGTGSAFAKKYYNNSALITSGDRTLLVDCGITAPMAMHELGKRFVDLHGIFVTHLHADHCGGLEEAGLSSYYLHDKKLTLYVPEALIEPLWEHSLKAGMIDAERRRLEDYFDVRPVKEGVPIRIMDGLTIEILETRHIPGKKSYSLILNDKLFYSADMVFDRELLDRLYEERGCRTFLHDCQFVTPGTVHATLEELLTLPEEIQRCLYLMHYGDDMESYVGRTGKMRFLIQGEIYTFGS